MAIDVADAFLTVEQQRPTTVTCTTAVGTSTKFKFGKILPGQRDGRQLWHESRCRTLKFELDIEQCAMITK